MCDPVISVLVAPSSLPDMPIPAEWIEEGNPVAHGQILLYSSDRRTASGLWECTPGRFMFIFPWDEFARLTDGEATIVQDGGPTIIARAGDIVHFPRNARTHWHITRTVRKVFFVRTPNPMTVESSVTV